MVKSLLMKGEERNMRTHSQDKTESDSDEDSSSRLTPVENLTLQGQNQSQQ